MTQPALRALLRDWFEAVLPQLDPGAALRAAVHRDGAMLRAGGEPVDLAAVRRAFVVAIGKAAAPMAAAMLPLLQDRPCSGVVAAPTAVSLPPLETFVAGHPLPDAGSVAAAERALALLGNAGAADLVVFLLSGGGSALCERPLVPEIALDDLRELHHRLVGSGAGIAEMNVVRKHFSGVKGGRLAVRTGAAQQLTLLLSDVPRGQLDAVASGPTLPDGSIWADVDAVLARHGLAGRLPRALLRARRTLPETPKPGHRAFARAQWHVLLDSAHAAELVAAQARRDGWHCVVRDESAELPVADLAERLLQELRRLRGETRRPVVLIDHGEASCALPPVVGVGGRNQQFALECALRCVSECIAVLGAGTDGIDGNSPAAGAVADGSTVLRAELQGCAAADYLRRFDAWSLFSRLDDAIVTGRTATNVRDLRILIHA